MFEYAITMSKKQKKIKKVKKAVKAAKAKPASKKGKPAKAVKKAKAKSARPPASKTKAVKKSVKKIVKKKSTIKKVVKPVKKSAKKIDKKEKKIVKPLKKGTTKPVKKAVKKVAAKPLKKVAKPIKSAKPTKPAKPVKAITPAKIAEKEKSAKKIEPKKVELFTEVKKSPKRKKKKQKSEDDDEPVIIEDILIEQLIQSTKRKAKQPKVPKILKTFVNPMTSLTVATPAGKKGAVVPKKEPKGKFELEYVVRTSAGILYELLTTPSGLSEWFADDVNIRDGIFTFFWDGSEQKARLLGFKEDQYVRMQWIDKPEGSYFEFRIQKDELTGDISLMIIDFADEASDMQTSKLLWDSQVNKLLNVLGSN